MAYSYEYPRPAVTVDCIIIRNTLKPEILLIKRKFEPFKDSWALPGGFVDSNETLEQAAIRELEEETNITDIDLLQMHAFSELNRDPRGQTISIVFYGFTHSSHVAVANDDAKEVNWFLLNKLPELAFDHAEIINRFTKTII
ncbi:MAG TPA: NUDIX hydrolase [Bacteroidales bacterium]|nr:MAG: hypothetical protein A2W98_00030 [Bacteroidetes bacterium GWF2_33_38]OFY74536.1 MAG: hypothetical protein A2265_00785 [Bacteroidetes bacterium RIFOXYA12_FULL_33_9]HBF87962.1 NUDIX hydrolase [Bacteroidales bacterium]